MSAGATARGAEFASALVQRAMTAGADAAEVEHQEAERFEVDADTGGVKLLRSNVVRESTVTVLVGKRKGSATLVGHAARDIEQALEDATAAARAAPADDANRIADAQPPIASDHGPRAADRDAMYDLVHAHLAEVRTRFPLILTRHAVLVFDDRHRWVASSAGVCQEERRGGYHFSTLFGARDGERSTSFNYSGASFYEPPPMLMAAGDIERCLEEVVRSFEPRPVPEKFTGAIVVTPDCVGPLLGAAYRALGGYALLAGTTPFADREGERIASSAFTLQDRPRDASFPDGADFDEHGVPTCDRTVVRDGVLEDFMVDFFCAGKLGRPQTAGRSSLVVAGGERPIGDLLREVDRGVWLARFSGGQPNEKLDFSGVAKNAFYIEGGEVKHPLIETMISGNLQDLLMGVRAVSRDTVDFGGSRYPYLIADGLTISGR